MRLIDVDVLINEIKEDTETVIEQDDKVGSFWLGYFAGLVIKQPIIQPDVADINVGDTISRQQAIDGKISIQLADGVEIYSDEAVPVEYLKRLPTIQPKPHEGHWIDKGWSGDWAWQTDGRGNCWRVIGCSECGKNVSTESNYCPHCGAKMRRKIND